MVPKLGTIPADREGAYRALKDGYSVMVYPGGEREALRPSRDRKKVDFYGRKGFIKLALRAGVPIVPIVSIGAHETYMIFARGERLARALGFRKAFRLHGMPITLRSLFFLWSIVGGVLSLAPLALIPASFFSIFVPLPAKMTFKILPALDPRTLWNDALSEEVNIDFIYEHILQNMQEIASKAYADRRFPVLG
jgi:1-acyl-sn-glycerol-3-phosphate acyltransferase